LVWAARYEAFGAAQVESQGIEQPLRFPGQYYDAETGLHYNRARYYDPALGSYLSLDPAFSAGSDNLYRYAAGNPINVSDPLGLFGESWPGWVKTTVSVLGGAAVVGAAILLAPAELTVAAAIGLTMAVGAVAGAVGFGLDAAMTDGGCVWCGIKKGVVLGSIGALPFAAAILIAGPAALGTGIVWGLGAVSGAISYASDCLFYDHPWNTWEFVKTVGISAVSAGVFKYLGGKLAQLRTPPKAPPPDTTTTPQPKTANAPNPETVERTGKPTAVETNRPKEQPYRQPKDLQVLREGEPIPELDPSKGKHLWQVNDDGSMGFAPEKQEGHGINEHKHNGRDVKHGDMNPGPEGLDRGVNRAGGELIPQFDENGNHTGWKMNNDSSNTFARSDGTRSSPDNLRAAKELMKEGGMDTSNIELETFDNQPVAE
jgi:RHS repeat-associated protein